MDKNLPDIAKLTIFSYYANGNRATLTYPASGLVTTYTYNLANLVTNLTNKDGAATRSSFAYAYYLDGNQARKTESTGKVTHYYYDGLGRLTYESELLPIGEMLDRAYAYDVAGNRDTMTVFSKAANSAMLKVNYTTNYDYDTNNRLLSETKEYANIPKTETAEYQYDKNGNQISKTTFVIATGGGSEEVGMYLLGAKLPTPREDYTVEINEYDGFNRLAKVQNDEGTSRYAYKADGLRLSKDVNGAKTTHVWDGSNIVLDYGDYGAVNDVYLRGINLIKSSNQGYYLYNAHGDVVQLVKNGAITMSYEFDAFGVEIGAWDGDENPFRYAGEYFDKETGSIYLRARYYDPTTGRMRTQDTVREVTHIAPNEKAIVDPLSLNYYTYCYNNPLRYTDSSGNVAVVDDIVIIYVGGLVITTTAAWVASPAGQAFLDGAQSLANQAVSGISSVYDSIFGTSSVSNVSYAASNDWLASAKTKINGMKLNFGNGNKGPKLNPETLAKATTGYSTWEKFRDYLGSAGEGFQWHHIVEKSQALAHRAGFSQEMVNNIYNIMKLPTEIHHQISKFYSSTYEPAGMVFRDWLNTKSFDEQYE